MYLNTTTLIKWLGLELGITHSFLEVSTEFMLEVIRLQTLPEFSKYYPALFRFTLDTTDPSTRLEGKKGAFRIPISIMEPKRIIGVSKLINDVVYGTREGFLYGQDINVLDRQIRADIASVASLPITYRYFPPNIVEVYPHNLYLRKFLLEIKVSHDPNFFTIPKSMVSEFMKLALVDVKRALYNIRKNFPSISTAFGSLEFDMDSVQGMDDKRAEILEVWAAQYYKAAGRRRMWVG